MGRKDPSKPTKPAVQAAPASNGNRPKGQKTKHRKSDASRKHAPARRLARTLDRFVMTSDETRRERMVKEAQQCTAVSEDPKKAMTGAEYQDYLRRTRKKPINPLKLARQLMPNARF